MLPILRMISVGGVSLAIVILLLALSPPEDFRLHLARVAAPARGPLLELDHHPEWRHFLIQAALLRADELQRLRDLPDSPVKTAPIPSEPTIPETVLEPAIIESGGTLPEPAAAEPTAGPVAGLPAESSDPDNITGSIGGTADDTSIPIDIGAASSAELPVLPAEETPPVIRTPQREKPRESRSPRMQRPRQARPAAPPEAPPQFNLLQALLELFKPRGDAATGAPGATRAN